MRTLLIAGLVVTGACLTACPAWAQRDISAGGISAGAPKAPGAGKAAEPPPAAVPGARARADSVAPADRATADLPPNEALFDAINRGDIGSARDALSRGADLDATNLLGLTPTELSVDLARNDITFLLLSMRGGGGGPGGAQPQLAQASPPPAERRRGAQAARSQPVKPVAAEAPARTLSPALFAGNGGTANPAVGFLGFDHSH